MKTSKTKSMYNCPMKMVLCAWPEHQNTERSGATGREKSKKRKQMALNGVGLLGAVGGGKGWEA